MEKLIKINNVSKNYGKFQVLKDVDLELESGKIVGLCGPNGAGKTTLIKTITGLLRAYDGNITVGGYAVGPESKALVSYLPDINYFEDDMSGKRAVELYSDMYADFDEHIFRELMHKMKLEMSQKIRKMSKGMKEKFQLALCLSRQASIYILDEPIAGVDPASRDLIIETILGNYSEGALMIISTHLISDIEPVLDEVIFLNNGEVTLHDNCDALRERTDMSINELFREEFKWSSN
ncbi:MAG: ABC transporter ATP-binding protein [Erysipelothrix sp.]|nr:ABC transporter ATP-binding protein [Erysipelothrix sp.]